MLTTCSPAIHAWPMPQVADLIASTDALAVTEHGQFCRSPEACQVGAVLAESRQRCWWTQQAKQCECSRTQLHTCLP